MTAVASAYALALGAMTVLGTSIRWIFTDSATPPDPDVPDYGLLRAAAVVEDMDTGQSVRALLIAARVRATVAAGPDGLVRVLVFPHEYDRARRLVSWVL